MLSTLRDRRSFKRKADDAMLIDPPTPSPKPKSPRMTPTEKQGHFVSRPGPVDDETMVRPETRIDRIRHARIHIIRGWVVVAAALENKLADLAQSVKATTEVIMEGIKMPWYGLLRLRTFVTRSSWWGSTSQLDPRQTESYVLCFQASEFIPETERKKGGI